MNHDEMPRERLFNLGVEALSNVELLAILLKTGTKGQPVMEFSKNILEQRQGLLGLFESRIEDLENIKGLGKAKIAEIMVITELCKRYVCENIKKSDWQFRSIEDIYQFLMLHYKGLKTEEVGMLLLDQQHRFIHYEKLASGSVQGVCLPWRGMTKLILDYHAAAIILVHNHPSGETMPSENDILLTCEIEQFLSHLDVRLLDHVIVAHNEIVSVKYHNNHIKETYHARSL